MYREYLEAKKASDVEKEQLMKERNDLQATKEQDQIQVQELRVCEQLGGCTLFSDVIPC